MAFATKQKLICPKYKASKIVFVEDCIGAKELKARICQKCNVPMESELCEVGSSLTLSDHVYNMLRGV